jgi:hypothetical protein
MPTGINECIRFSEYEIGISECISDIHILADFFRPHRDGSFVWNEEERSIYTLQIYLNSGILIFLGNINFLRLCGRKHQFL